MTSVSVFQSREVSTLWRSLCTVNYREWFGTTGFCVHCGGFRKKGSPLSEVPLYQHMPDSYCHGIESKLAKVIGPSELKAHWWTFFCLYSIIPHMYMYVCSLVSIASYSVPLHTHLIVDTLLYDGAENLHDVCYATASAKSKFDVIYCIAGMFRMFILLV